MTGVVARVLDSSILAATRDGDVVMNCADARLWKGGIVTMAAVQPGDLFYAQGLLASGGTFRVSRLWLNIVNIVGIVERVSGDTFDLRHTHLGVRVLDRVSRVTVDASAERRRTDPQRETRPGDYVQVVGVQTSPHTVRATRMWG